MHTEAHKCTCPPPLVEDAFPDGHLHSQVRKGRWAGFSRPPQGATKLGIESSGSESRTALKARFLSRQDSAGGTSTVQSRVLSPLFFILL